MGIERKNLLSALVFLQVLLISPTLIAGESPCKQALSRNPWQDIKIGSVEYQFNVKYRQQTGSKYFVMKSRDLKTPEKKWYKETIPNDARTKSILATSELGEEALHALLSHFAGREDSRAAYVFIDINDLEKVNYFGGLQAAGDFYLERVGDAVRDSLRYMDISFRVGGDELGLILSDVDEEAVVQILERVNERLASDSEIQSLFRQNFHWAEEKLIEGLDSYSQRSQIRIYDLLMNKDIKTYAHLQKALPKWIWQKGELVPQLLEKDLRLMQLIENYYIIKRLRPTLSMGSSMIGQGDTIESLRARSEEQAAHSKFKYKASLGLDLKKYSSVSSTYSSEQLVEMQNQTLERPPISYPVPAPQ